MTSLKTAIESLTGLKVKRGRTRTFLTFQHRLFEINYRIDDDAIVILWIVTYCPCEGLGTILVNAYKHFSRQEVLPLIADRVAEEAIPFWLKVGFQPIPHSLDFIWMQDDKRSSTT